MNKITKYLIAMSIVLVLTIVFVSYVPDSTSCMNYYISYNWDGGVMDTENPESYNLTNLPIALKEPVKDGYEFLGWYDEDGNNVNTITRGTTGDMFLTAKWTPKYYITYNLDGGVNGKNPSYYTQYSDTIVLNAPSKEGYEFLGWYNGETKVQCIDKETVGNIFLTAKFRIEDYTIRYYVENGTNSSANATIYNVNSEEIVLKDAISSRQGYDFAGWYNDNNERVVRISKGSTGNIRLVAHWTPKVYIITYELNGGSVVKNPTFYTIENGDIILKNPVRDGYDFAGWYLNGNLVSKISNGTIGDLNLVARWKNYNITYSLNGGTNADNPNDYCKSKLPFTLKNPTKQDMVFAGWYMGEKKITEINETIVGDVVLTAEWGSVGLEIAGDRLIGASACTAQNVVVPKGVKYIDTYAFSGNNTASTVQLPNTLIQIGSYAFYNCTKLNSIVIPQSVLDIREFSFSGCISLNNVQFEEGSGVTVFTRGIFENCVRLTTINIPEMVKSIKENAFNGCTSLKNVVLPNGLIYLSGFSNSGITKITIPSTVTFIDSYAFKNTKLVSVVVPQSVETMGMCVFAGCDENMTIFVENNRIPADWDIEWNALNLEEKNVFKFCLFSINMPEQSGNYWHYVNGIPTIWTV